MMLNNDILLKLIYFINKTGSIIVQKLLLPYSQEQLYGQFDSAIDEQSHSSDCRLDTCSCCGLTTGETKVKLALFLLVLLAMYIGYLVMTEQEQPEELQKGKEFIEEIAGNAEKVKDK